MTKVFNSSWMWAFSLSVAHITSFSWMKSLLTLSAALKKTLSLSWHAAAHDRFCLFHPYWSCLRNDGYGVVDLWQIVHRKMTKGGLNRSGGTSAVRVSWSGSCSPFFCVRKNAISSERVLFAFVSSSNELYIFFPPYSCLVTFNFSTVSSSLAWAS